MGPNWAPECFYVFVFFLAGAPSAAGAAAEIDEEEDPCKMS